LSSLKGYLLDYGKDIDVETHHPYLEVAKKIGINTYKAVSENGWVGEALYCGLLFLEQRDEARKVFHKFFRRENIRPIPDFDILTAQLDAQLDDWLERRNFTDCSLVGFSICFSQLPATLLAAVRFLLADQPSAFLRPAWRQSPRLQCASVRPLRLPGAHALPG